MSHKVINTLAQKNEKILPPGLAVGIAAMGLVFDLNMPLGVAGGIPYVALVMLGLWASRREQVLYLAIFATILTFVGYYLSPPGGVAWVVFTNRMLALFAIWATAMVIYNYAKLMDNQRKMASAVEQSSVGIIITDTNGVIEYANPKVSHISGYSQAEVVGQGPRIFKSDLTADETYENLWETVLAGDEWQGELINKNKDGDYYWEELQVFPIRGRTGRVKNFVAIMEDISERKKNEEKLIAAIQVAENANEAKSSFLANMSHEFRTPLNAILGFSETIKMQILGPMGNDKYTQYIDHIHGSAVHLGKLVEEILDLSKIEAGIQEIDEKEIIVTELLQSCLALVNEQSRSAKIRINTHVDPALPLLFADERMIKQVILNLLSNAIKFSKKGNEVILKSFLSEGGQLMIEVSDTGIGISRDDYEKVFAIFGQAENIFTRSHDGAGLGLPISRRLVELHSGTLELESEFGEGTTVTLAFPPDRAVTTSREGLQSEG
ncbi:MAG: PAS domain-containing sensor histidine kinase [Rhodospirillaceae bacterium]|nr:PAS domain-containing sensor histidine kinase [Rhodospirillaceae bacterium]MBT5245203.1 PAS domain-containing sensor histidine kinase [Rhodospirillaceae bacterium]MBT6241953.1 PAS domain-containing sensor histidine kinase [Rhodospirillaceae bacterium]